MAKQKAQAPGEVLATLIAEYNITHETVAEAIGEKQAYIRSIIYGYKDIYAETGLKLAKAFGTPTTYWIDLQTAYDLSKVDKASLKAVKKLKKQPKVAVKNPKAGIAPRKLKAKN